MPAAHVAESLLRSTSSGLPPLPSALNHFTQDLDLLGAEKLGDLWLSRLQELRELCSSLRADNDSLIASLHPDVALVHRQAGPGGAHLLALRRILEDMGWHDDTLMSYLESGFPMAGDLPISHLVRGAEQDLRKDCCRPPQGLARAAPGCDRLSNQALLKASHRSRPRDLEADSPRGRHRPLKRPKEDPQVRPQSSPPSQP